MGKTTISIFVDDYNFNPDIDCKCPCVNEHECCATNNCSCSCDCVNCSCTIDELKKVKEMCEKIIHYTAVRWIKSKYSK
jgi:hypothetical protein